MSSRKKHKKSHPVRRFFIKVWLFVLLALLVWVILKMDNPVSRFIHGADPTAVPIQTMPAAEITPTPEPTAAPTPAPTPVILDHPYYLVVDRGANTVTAYTIAQDGTYTLPARVMICATDQLGQYPENGLYALQGERKRWYAQVSMENTYFQYATRITDKVMFTSVPYLEMAPDQLNVDAYYKLGENATTGNIWLLCEDARWIYENVEAGTPVLMISGGVLDVSVYAPDLGDSAWDPTDGDPYNLDYNEAYAKPAATPWLGVTPKPTPDWSDEKRN